MGKFDGISWCSVELTTNHCFFLRIFFLMNVVNFLRTSGKKHTHTHENTQYLPNWNITKIEIKIRKFANSLLFFSPILARSVSFSICFSLSMSSSLSLPMFTTAATYYIHNSLTLFLSLFFFSYITLSILFFSPALPMRQPNKYTYTNQIHTHINTHTTLRWGKKSKPNCYPFTFN